MNAFRARLETLFRALLLVLVIAAFAIDAARAAQPTAAVQVDCSHRYISQVDAGRLFGTHNLAQTYARRHAFYANLARACAGGRLMPRPAPLPAPATTAPDGGR